MPDYNSKDMSLFRSVTAQMATEEEPEREPELTGKQPDPIARVSCRLGDSSCAGAHASVLRKTTNRPMALRSIQRLQQQYGNRYVGTVLNGFRRIDRSAGSEGNIERGIEESRNGGQPMDPSVRRSMESAFGADFGGVRIHTDRRSDELNQSLNAKAFTTGQDIFFRQGAHDPGSSSGKELLAHELTHVVQQNGNGIQRKMTVSEPGDPQEVEADEMAKAVVNRVENEEDRLHGQPERDKEDENAKLALPTGGSPGRRR